VGTVPSLCSVLQQNDLAHVLGIEHVIISVSRTYFCVLWVKEHWWKSWWFMCKLDMFVGILNRGTGRRWAISFMFQLPHISPVIARKSSHILLVWIKLSKWHKKDKSVLKVVKENWDDLFINLFSDPSGLACIMLYVSRLSWWYKQSWNIAIGWSGSQIFLFLYGNMK